MSTYDERSSEHIQREIDHTRTQMRDTLEAIRQKFSPGQLLDQTLDYFKHGGTGQFSSNLGETVKSNPVPVALVGIGLAWLMTAGSRPSHTSSTRGTSEYTKDKLHGAATRVSDTAEQLMQGARERTGEIRERMGDMAHSTQESISETASHVWHEHPLILGALGFALGAALGAGLPPTRQEDALMGELRDEYVSQAKAMGEEQLEKAKHVATAARDAAKEEAEKQGVTSPASS